MKKLIEQYQAEIICIDGRIEELKSKLEEPIRNKEREQIAQRISTLEEERTGLIYAINQMKR